MPTDNWRDANQYIDYAIPTGLGDVRNVVVVRTSDAIVAFPGKYGTLSEMAYAMMFGKPIVSVSAWKLGDEMTQVEDPLDAAKLAWKWATENQ